MIVAFNKHQRQMLRTVWSDVSTLSYHHKLAQLEYLGELVAHAEKQITDHQSVMS